MLKPYLVGTFLFGLAGMLGHFVGLPSSTDTKPTLAEQPQAFRITPETPLWEVIYQLGEHRYNLLKDSSVSARVGEKLITSRKLKSTFKSFVPCVACHSTMPEHYDAAVIDPQKRLLFADSTRQGFMPGTPFYGLVNRTQFFADDFQKKLAGEGTMRQANIDIRQAIRTCNQVYANGRRLEEREVEAILAYFWTLELKMKDLQISEEEISSIEFAINTDAPNAAGLRLLRRYYVDKYPATLIAPEKIVKRRGTSPILNNFQNGKRVYKWSCLYCHTNKRYSNTRLDYSKNTFKRLKKHLDRNTKSCVYDLIRYNPESRAANVGMAPYTKERMSNQQLQDLRYYIIKMAKFGHDGYGNR